MSQSHGTNLWQEPAGSGATPRPVQYVWQLVAGYWTPVASNSPQARLLDNGSGTFVLTPGSAAPLVDELLLVRVRSTITTY